MSRVADALRRAESTTAPAAASDAARLVPQQDMAMVPVAWEVEPEGHHGGAPSSYQAPRVVTTAPEPGLRMEFVELVQRVFRPATADPTARSVTFVSLGAGQPRRAVALDVAATLADYGAGTVCVVDASFGAAALHERAGLPPGPGLCDALLASRPAAPLAVSLSRQLWLVPAGEQMCATPGWVPEGLARTLRHLGSTFDYLIVEAPPLADASEVPGLLTVASLTDGVVLVLESARTRRDVAHDIRERLHASGVTLLGVVLTVSTPVASRRAAASR